MDFESLSEDEDLEEKMYAMIHFVDSENTERPEIHENSAPIENNTNSNDYFINKYSLASKNDENSNKSPISQRNIEPYVTKDITVDKVKGDKEISNRNGKQIISDLNGVNGKSTNNRIITVDKVPSIANSDTEFIMKISLKNNEKNEEQCNPITETNFKNQDVCYISDASDEIDRTPKQSLNASSESEITKKVSKSQTKTIDDSTQDDCTILIKNQRTNENFSSKKNAAKKTNSPQLRSSSPPFKISSKTHKKSSPLKSESVHIIDLNTTDDESDIEVIPQVIVPITAIYVESSDDEVAEDNIVNSTKSFVAEERDSTSSFAQPEKSSSINKGHNKSNISSDKTACVSPVPSIMSSVSDEFILADCSNLNITSNETDPSNLKFNFELHGADLCDEIVQHTPKKRSKKKSISDVDKPDYTKTLENQDAIKKLATANTSMGALVGAEHGEGTFATPKANVKKKNSITKSISYTVNNVDYTTPSLDVYESESSDFPESVVDMPVTFTPKRKKKTIPNEDNEVDNLVMANVIGIDESSNLDSEHFTVKDIPNKESVKVNKNKNSKNKNKIKFDGDKHFDDSESFIIFDSGADFDHIKLQKEMPSGKEFWPIDLADKLRDKRNRRPQVICGFCNKPGHREDNCYSKPKKCVMCGAEGHKELRCPNKICLNCGSRNDMFSSECRNCYKWKKIFCVTCKSHGHPSNRCPDIWRRYHRTITNEVPLIEDRSRKNSSQLFCSGCTGRGHLINKCKEYISFSEFKIPSPYIFDYTPIYDESIKRQTHSTDQSTNDGNSQCSNQVPLKRKGEKEFIVSHGKKLSDLNDRSHENNSTLEVVSSDRQTENFDDNVTSSHILLTQECIERLNTNEGKEFINLSHTKYNLSINQSKIDLGDILLLEGSTDEQEKFQADFKKWMNINETIIPSSPRCHLPQNKLAAVNYLVNNLNSLNRDFGNPRVIYSNLQSWEKEYKKLVGCQNKLINSKKLQSLCSKINNSRQLLNKILIGQAGFSNGYANIDKLRSIIIQLKYSQDVHIKSKIRKQIISCFLPIFSEAARDDYHTLINQYNLGDTNSTETKPKNNKKRNRVLARDNRKKKSLLDRIRLTRRKLQDSSRSLGDPYAMVDSTCQLLDLCENQIQNDQTSKDTFYNLKKVTSRVDKYIFETQ